MESFYGGRQGASIAIKARFKYITSNLENKGTLYIDPYYQQAYNELIAQGLSSEEAKAQLKPDTMDVNLADVDYKDVWYGEYCIIDPANKNNVNNGKLYRRTLKGAGDDNLVGGIAEYAGQIVGPAGPSLEIGHIGSVADIEQSFDNIEIGLDDTITYKNEQGNISHFKDEDSNIFVNNFGSDINLIPGNSKTQYLDGKTYIQHGGYNWYNVRLNTDEEDISQLYIGFDIPYYVTEFTGGTALNYTKATTVTKTINTNAAPFDNAPFYEKYKIQTPRGITGAWFGNIRIVTNVAGTTYYAPTDITYTAASDTYTFGASTITSEDFTTGQDGWVGSFYWYKSNGAVQELTNVFFGLRRDVRNITTSTDGTLTFTMTDNSVITHSKVINWIKSASISAAATVNNGVITQGDVLNITFNNSNIQTISKNLRLIAGIDIDNEGTVTIYRSDNTKNIFTKKINWIKSANVDTNQNLNINFNNDNIADISVNLSVYSNLKISTAGVVTVTHSTAAGPETLTLGTLTWITGAHVVTGDETGTNITPYVGHLLLQFNNTSITNAGTKISSGTYKNWYDLGVVKIIQEGLYVTSNGYTITENQDGSWSQDINTVLANADKDRAQIVTITKASDGTYQRVVYYYDTNSQTWESLGSVSTSALAAVIQDINGIKHADDAIILSTEAIVSNNNLSTPWKASV